jgi:hypothetical protein
MPTRLFAGLFVFVLASLAAAQTAVFRTLPEEAPRGYLSHVAENVVSLDGRQLMLAPGAQIRGANNLIVVPAALPKDSLVKYQLSASGELVRAWVLTADEAARTDKGSPPRVQGIPIEQVLPKYEPERALRYGEQPAPPPPPPPSGLN